MAMQAFEAPQKKRRTRKSARKDVAAPSMNADGVIEIPQDQDAGQQDNITVDTKTGAVTIDNEDGSITVDPTGQSLRPERDEDASSDHGANIADDVDPIELGRIADDLLTAIAADKADRSQWEQMRAKCIDLLGLKIEDPKGDVSRSAMGVATSVVRDPILLEAVERFRANAYAELCPASGPVKVVNLSDNKSETDPLADELQKDLNYYLTTTASEYYPDTRYMLWWTGLASGTFKKIYKCPLRQRPVSEYVDGADLIVPSNATDMKNASRVTHEVKMPRDIMRAMQLEGVYRDVVLTEPMQSQSTVIDLKKASVEGKAAQPQRIEDQEYTVFECYCKLDIRGFEHKQKGKPTGLPLPYRVTIEENSRQVLEIRRNWDEEDNEETYRPPHIPFVLFPYSTGISRIYGSGLGQMMGNMASALTALLRISIDNGMMGNYPGLLKAKGDGRQISNEIMVPPGGVAEIDTGGLPIQQTIMGVPFKDVSAQVVALIEQTRGVAQRLGGTADLPVGEGKQDAPVGTTLALIEQSTKVEGSVHKALHAAQAEEFRLLVRLFKDDPEALWRGNRRPAMGNAVDEAAKQARVEKFKRALDNCDIVPMADPNVQSGMHRNLIAMGVKQFTAGNPLYDPVKVDRYVAKQAFKVSDADFNSWLAPPQMGQPQIDPALMAQIELKKRELDIKEASAAAKAQNDVANRESKENIETLKIASQHSAEQGAATPDGAPSQTEIEALRLKGQQVALQAAKMHLDAHNAQQDREAKLTAEALKIAQAVAVHPFSDQIVDEQLEQMAPLISPAKREAPSLSNGGRVGYAGGGTVPNFGSSPGGAWMPPSDPMPQAQPSGQAMPQFGNPGMGAQNSWQGMPWQSQPQQPPTRTFAMPPWSLSKPQRDMSRPEVQPQDPFQPDSQGGFDGPSGGRDMDPERAIQIALAIAQSRQGRGLASNPFAQH